MDDQEKALKFYTEVLGFIKKFDIPLGKFRWITVVSSHDPEGAELVFEPNDNHAALTYQNAIYEQGIPANAFEVADIDQEYERLS